jgi:hypothetical protein
MAVLKTGGYRTARRCTVNFIRWFGFTAQAAVPGGRGIPEFSNRTWIVTEKAAVGKKVNDVGDLV